MFVEGVCWGPQNTASGCHGGTNEGGRGVSGKL